MIAAGAGPSETGLLGKVDACLALVGEAMDIADGLSTEDRQRGLLGYQLEIQEQVLLELRSDIRGLTPPSKNSLADHQRIAALLETVAAGLEKNVAGLLARQAAGGLKAL